MGGEATIEAPEMDYHIEVDYTVTDTHEDLYHRTDYFSCVDEITKAVFVYEDDEVEISSSFVLKELEWMINSSIASA